MYLIAHRVKIGGVVRTKKKEGKAAHCMSSRTKKLYTRIMPYSRTHRSYNETFSQRLCPYVHYNLDLLLALLLRYRYSILQLCARVWLNA